MDVIYNGKNKNHFIGTFDCMKEAIDKIPDLVDNKEYEVVYVPAGEIINDYKNYIITTEGQIFSILSKKYLKMTKGNKHLQVGLYTEQGRKRRFVHRLVLSTFSPIENEEKYIIHHLDGNRENNRISNLVYMTRSDHTRFHNSSVHYTLIINNQRIATLFI